MLCTADQVAANLGGSSTGAAPDRIFSFFGIGVSESAVSEQIAHADAYITHLLSPGEIPPQARLFCTDLASLYVVGKVLAGLGIGVHFDYGLGQLNVTKPLNLQLQQVVDRLTASVNWWKRTLLPAHRVRAQGDMLVRGTDLLVPQEGGVSRPVAPDSPWQGV